jgi:hypothetical protein
MLQLLHAVHELAGQFAEPLTEIGHLPHCLLLAGDINSGWGYGTLPILARRSYRSLADTSIDPATAGPDQFVQQAFRW